MNYLELSALGKFLDRCHEESWSDVRIVDELELFVRKRRGECPNQIEHDNCIILLDGLRCEGLLTEEYQQLMEEARGLREDVRTMERECGRMARTNRELRDRLIRNAVK